MASLLHTEPRSSTRAFKHWAGASRYFHIEMKRVQMITYSLIICTSNHSGAILDRNVINSSLTLIDLSWPSDSMRRIIH